tara:strand:+ start:1945 stop:2187 length:243 start_codon:yes stop_codon:yes gene_type:complete
MPSLDKSRILKSASQLQRSTSPRPKNNYSQFGVSDRASLSKKGNHNGGIGHSRCYELKEIAGVKLWFAMPYTREAGAGKK